MSARRRRPGDALRMPEPLRGDIAGAAPGASAPVRRIADAWPAAVGDALARASQPARLTRDGVLVVHAADASWVHAITLEQRTILRRLGEHLGDQAPAALRVEVGPVRVPEEAVDEPPMAILPEAQARAVELAAGVQGEALRRALERAIAVTLSKPKTP